jgi:hypothetical protein
MNLGYSIGIDRGERFITLDSYDQENVMKSMIFPKKNWNRFIQLIPQIEDCLLNSENIEFKQISGSYILSITVCYNFVDIYVYLIGGSGTEFVSNMIVSLIDWIAFETKIEQINEPVNIYETNRE